MKRLLKMRLLLGILAAVPPRLCIHIYDAAGVPVPTLQHAMKEAARILTATGLDSVWQQGPADAPEAYTSDQSAVAWRTSPEPDARSFLVVKIIRDFPDRSLPGALGFSLPDARFGPHAHIFYNRIEAASASGEVGLATLLGHAIAHEIGHVLLGTPQHSPAGIMKARWGRSEYRDVAKGYLRFAPAQCVLIRDQVALRLKHAEVREISAKE